MTDSPATGAPAAGEPLPPEVTRFIGTSLEGDREAIGAGDIADFAEAIRWPNPGLTRYTDEVAARASALGGLVAPPTFVGRLARRRGFSLPLPTPAWLRDRPGAMTEVTIEQLEPIRAGDTVRSTATTLDITERTDDHGRVVYLDREFEFRNQLDQVVGRNRRHLAKFLDGDPRDPIGSLGALWQPDRPLGREDVPRFTRTVGLMELNRFAGANREWGRYHMDREYARSIGLPDVLVIEHLKLAYLGNALEDWSDGRGRPGRLDVRFIRFDYVGATLSACGIVTAETEVRDGREVSLRLWIEDESGRVSAQGEARWLFDR